MLITFVCARYLVEHARFKKSAANDAHLIEKHIKPNLGSMGILDVRYADIARLHAAMRDTPYQANRVLSLLSMIFNLAERWELRPAGSNPCRPVKRYKERHRTRCLSDIDIKRLYLALDGRMASRPLEAGLLLLLLFTGARCGEIKAAKWNEITGAELFAPDSKTGQRVIYLTPQALAVLARTPRCREWIIGPDVNPRYVWASVAGDLGLKDLRIHDLRHCFASVGVAADLSLPKIGNLLGHSSAATTNIYGHMVLSEGRRTARAIGEHFANLVA